MRKGVRIRIGLFCLLFAAVLLLSGALSAAHSQHECTVEDCLVCALLSGWTRLLRCMTAAALLSFAARFPQLTAIMAASARIKSSFAATLVSLKVKLSD